MGHDRLSELRRRQHAAFDVHMGIDKSRQGKPTLRLDDLRIGPQTMRRIRTAIGKPPPRNGDILGGKNLAGLDIDPVTASDDKIRRGPAGRHGHQVSGHSRPGFKSRKFHAEI